MASKSRKPSDALKAQKKNMEDNGTLATMEDFKGHAIINAADSMYDKGTVLIIPEKDFVMGMEKFVVGTRTIEAPYIWVDTEKHGIKKLFLSQIAKTIMPYEEEDGEVIQKGEGKHAEGELFDKARDCKNSGDLLELIAGTDIEVYNVEPVQTAKYVNNVITGVRQAQLAMMQWKLEKS